MISQPQELLLERDGNTYWAVYIVEDDTVTVFPLSTHRSTQVNGSPAEAVARRLLEDLIDEGLAQPLG